MEEKLLKVIEKHQVLMLAVNKQMGVREAATCVGLSLCHIKRLVKKLRKAQGDFRTLLFQRQHPAWNKFPRDIRNAIVMLKEERPTRSNPFITELMNEIHSIKIHPTMMRNILIEAGKYSRSRERRRPAIQFEAKAFGEINQMDSTSGTWLDGYRQILCFKEIRKVAKENSFNLDGITYTILRQHNMVAFKVRLHIQPRIKIRVWHNKGFICELPCISKQKTEPALFIYGPRTCGDILASWQKRILTNSLFLAILLWFIPDNQPINRRYSIWSLLAKIYTS